MCFHVDIRKQSVSSLATWRPVSLIWSEGSSSCERLFGSRSAAGFGRSRGRASHGPRAPGPGFGRRNAIHLGASARRRVRPPRPPGGAGAAHKCGPGARAPEWPLGGRRASGRGRVLRLGKGATILQGRQVIRRRAQGRRPGATRCLKLLALARPLFSRGREPVCRNRIGCVCVCACVGLQNQKPKAKSCVEMLGPGCELARRRPDHRLAALRRAAGRPEAGAKGGPAGGGL